MIGTDGLLHKMQASVPRVSLPILRLLQCGRCVLTFLEEAVLLVLHLHASVPAKLQALGRRAHTCHAHPIGIFADARQRVHSPQKLGMLMSPHRKRVYDSRLSRLLSYYVLLQLGWGIISPTWGFVSCLGVALAGANYAAS